MKYFNLLLALVFVSLTNVSCDPNESNSNNNSNDDFAENFGATASRDFIGQIVDTDNNPLHNATVKIGTSTVQTDLNGVFIINGASVHERFAYITATKTGYVDGSRSLVPTLGKNNVKIMLLPNTPLETIQSGEQSEVALASGTKVVFDGAFQDENGAAYSGDVQVSLFHLLPSDSNISSLMPGMLYAETETGNEVALETFGMINVELKGSAGQKLNIANGHAAEIEVSIDGTQTATAPTTIPLWHFDEAVGYWKEDGVATKVGNKYVGEVSHFSWWNCDAFSATVSLTVTVVDSNGNPLQNVGIGLILNSTSFNSIIKYTTNTGQTAGLIPINEVFTLNIYDMCGEIILTTTIGPFSTDTILSSITLTNTTQISQIEGNLLKCDNSNVTNGYVIFYNGNLSYLVNVTNGTFSFSTLVCNLNTNFNLQGYDFDEQLSTGTSNYPFVFPITDVGDLMTCTTYTGPFLEGLYVVVVTREDGSVRTYTNEAIVNVSNNYFKTTTTGTWIAGSLGVPDQGYNFNYNSGYFTIPQQGLAQNSYNNLVSGIAGNNDNDGQIIDNSHFVTNYEISFAAGNRTYTNVYTRVN